MTTSSDNAMLEVRDLNKYFGAFQAVKNLNFQVKRGEVFGFLGPNGAGKTTTMRIVTCFMPATTGTIKVAGLDNLDHDLEVRKKIGYLPENAPLYNDMLVDEYLKFVGHIRGITGSKLQSRMDEMFAICGLTKMTKRYIGKLSKGYRQRVGLAQAIMHDPDLLILDEPMSGLDPNQIIEIRQLIKQIGQEKTVIYCSHILSEVSATCSRILIINDGSMVATGTPDELLSQSKTGTRYIARIKGDKDTIHDKLNAIQNVSSSSVEGSEGEWHKFALITEHNTQIGEQVFKTVVDNGWTLSELKQETASLEDVFTQLTRG